MKVINSLNKTKNSQLAGKDIHQVVEKLTPFISKHALTTGQHSFRRKLSVQGKEQREKKKEQ